MIAAITVLVSNFNPKRHLLRKSQWLHSALAQWPKRCSLLSVEFASWRCLQNFRVRLRVWNRMYNRWILGRPILAVGSDWLLSFSVFSLVLPCDSLILLTHWLQLLLLLSGLESLEGMASLRHGFFFHVLLALDDGLAGFSRPKAVIWIDFLDLASVALGRASANVDRRL